MSIFNLLFGTHGSITRSQWWLGQIIVSAISLIAYGAFWHAWTHSVILTVFLTITFGWMRISLDLKRFYDRGKSAWWLLIELVPVIGHIWIITELGFMKGKDAD